MRTLAWSLLVSYLPVASSALAVPALEWTPDHLRVEAVADGASTFEVTVYASKAVPETEVWLTPSLTACVTVEPASLPALSAGNEATLSLTIHDDGGGAGTRGGTLHLRDGSRTIARPLLITLTKHAVAEIEETAQLQVVLLPTGALPRPNIDVVEVRVDTVTILGDETAIRLSKGPAVAHLLQDGSGSIVTTGQLPAGPYQGAVLSLGTEGRVLVDGVWLLLTVRPAELWLDARFELEAPVTRLEIAFPLDGLRQDVDGAWLLDAEAALIGTANGFEGSNGALEPTGTAAVIGSEGGVLRLAGAELMIPAGALPAPVRLELQQTAADYPSYLLGPEGTEFLVPVFLILDIAMFEFPVGTTADDLTLLLDDEVVEVDVNAASNTVVAELHHFSHAVLTVKNRVYITIDDGPLPDMLLDDAIEVHVERVAFSSADAVKPRDERILSDMLDNLNVLGQRATFFHVGLLVKDTPELTARVLREGHPIGNHSYFHDINDFANMSKEGIKVELELMHIYLQRAAELAVRELVDGGEWEATSVRTRKRLLGLAHGLGADMFRPPGGRIACSLQNRYWNWAWCKKGLKPGPASNTPMELAVTELGMAIFNWDDDPEDWRLDLADRRGEETDLVSAVTSLDLDTDAILLLHERRLTADHLIDIVTALRQAGHPVSALDRVNPNGVRIVDASLTAARRLLGEVAPVPPGTVIVDDLDAEFHRQNALREHDAYWVASWSVGYPTTNPHMYHVRNNGTDASGGSSTAVIENFAQWQPLSLEPGFHRIEAYVPSMLAPTRTALYGVHHADGDDTCAVDQREHAQTWADLGSFRVSAGSDAFVLLTDLTEEIDSTTRVGFDAMRFVRTDETVSRVGAACESIGAGPMVSLEADPTTLPYAGQTTVEWTVSGADSCVASGGWTGVKSPAGGLEVLTSLTASSSLTLTCTDASGAESSDVVQVRVAPVITSVSPNPAIGVEGAQFFTILGDNFVDGASVTLRELTNDLDFPNCCIDPHFELTRTEITIKPNFTAFASPWSVQLVHPDGLVSNEFSFEVVLPVGDSMLRAVVRNILELAPAPEGADCSDDGRISVQDLVCVMARG